MQQESRAPISLFASYAPQDTPLEQELKEHLRPLQREGRIELWPDRGMSAGTEREQESSKHLQAAQIILLLVSPNFLASDFCYSVEMKQAMERHQRREVRLIPLLLRPCDWHTASFASLQCLPSNGQPVTTWSHREAAWLDVVQALSRVVDQLLREPRS
jgi:TIR domain-containing protein